MRAACDAWQYANTVGIPTIVFGPGSLNVAHSAEEHIPIKEILIAAEALLYLIHQLLDQWINFELLRIYDMAIWKRLDVYNKIIDQGLVPLTYHPDIEVLRKLVEATVRGGSNLFEFTNRGDGAYKVFEELLPYCRSEFPELVLGVGSILDPGTGALYMSLGADFIVGSVYNPDLRKDLQSKENCLYSRVWNRLRDLNSRRKWSGNSKSIPWRSDWRTKIC